MEDTPKTKKRKRDDTKNIYLCDQCEYSGCKQALYQHQKSKHEGIKYPCDPCKYISNQKGNLEKHKQSKHEGIKYPCDQCEYVETLQRDLKLHK